MPLRQHLHYLQHERTNTRAGKETGMQTGHIDVQTGNGWVHMFRYAHTCT